MRAGGESRIWKFGWAGASDVAACVLAETRSSAGSGLAGGGGLGEVLGGLLN